MNSSNSDPLVDFIYESVNADPAPQLGVDLPMLSEPSELLNWPRSAVRYPGITRLLTPRDPHCFYHAILCAGYLPYRLGRLNNLIVTPEQLVVRVRQELALQIVTPNDQGNTPYAELDGGLVAQFGEQDPRYSAAELQNQLLTGAQPTAVLQEFVNNALYMDIYFISGPDRDVVPCGTFERCILGRRSVVVMYGTNHFELVGISGSDGHIDTIFEPNHPFIVKIRSRLERLHAEV
jgi:hypothetical protein